MVSAFAGFFTWTPLAVTWSDIWLSWHISICRAHLLGRRQWPGLRNVWRSWCIWMCPSVQVDWTDDFRILIHFCMYVFICWIFLTLWSFTYFQTSPVVISTSFVWQWVVVTLKLQHHQQEVAAVCLVDVNDNTSNLVKFRQSLFVEVLVAAGQWHWRFMFGAIGRFGITQVCAVAWNTVFGTGWLGAVFFYRF